MNGVAFYSEPDRRPLAVLVSRGVKNYESPVYIVNGERKIDRVRYYEAVGSLFLEGSRRLSVIAAPLEYLSECRMMSESGFREKHPKCYALLCKVIENGQGIDQAAM